MLTVWGDSERFCDGVTRRNFLQVGALGAGLTLAELLRLRADAGTEPRPSAKAAILIYLPGGPSHMDMYDLKPDAPREFRGEFKPIKTNVSGVSICEHFPLQAKMWDRFACVRSVQTVDEHSDTMVMTGFPDRTNRKDNRPSTGSVISRLRGSGHGVPPFVSLRGVTRGCEPGYLGIAHRPFTPSGPAANNLRMRRELTLEHLEDRKSLRSAFDGISRDSDSSGTLRGMDSFTTQAFDLVVNGKVRNALDLSKEEKKSRERYKGCEQFLTARRLVEAGVACVTLSYGGWDTHGNNFKTLARQLPVLDRGLANLIGDLHERGLGNDVVTVMWGEFGRTPRVNRGAGRDHWSPVMSALVAGGGLKMGQTVGASTARGERPKDRRYTPSNVLSTVYRVLGIDPQKTFRNGSGRPVYILDEREPVKELLG
jgi:hypothetical protein